MSNDREGYEVRAYAPSDFNFVAATFLRGLYYGATVFSDMPKQTFMTNYKPVAEALVAKNDVWVACLKDAPDVILGYSIVSKDFTTIHWVFIKKAWRKQGIARAILPQYPTTVTHLTALGKSLLPKFKDCVFDPFKM